MMLAKNLTACHVPKLTGYPNYQVVHPSCPKLKTTSEIEYQRHIVFKHPGKPGYPNMAVAG
jgi:hypothetical protein